MQQHRFKHGVILDQATLHPQDLDLNRLWNTAENWDCYDNTAAIELLDRTQFADIIISNKVMLDEQLLQELPNLKLICIAATGTNNVNLEAAAQLGIPVCNVTRYATPSVAEHVFSLILALRRRLAEHHQAAVAQWPHCGMFSVLDYPMSELRGQTLGIIGYGELGHAVAKIASAFSMQVIISQRPGGNDKRRGRLPLDDVLSRSDILTLHCPLAPETESLIDTTALSKMKSGALLINTARGGIVDEIALLEALEKNKLGGAALDVLAKEPPNENHPLLNSNLKNLIITPHVAWASRESRQRLVDELVINIESFAQGEERNRVG